MGTVISMTMREKGRFCTELLLDVFSNAHPVNGEVLAVVSDLGGSINRRDVQRIAGDLGRLEEGQARIDPMVIAQRIIRFARSINTGMS